MKLIQITQFVDVNDEKTPVISFLAPWCTAINGLVPFFDLTALIAKAKRFEDNEVQRVIDVVAPYFAAETVIEGIAEANVDLTKL